MRLTQRVCLQRRPGSGWVCAVLEQVPLHRTKLRDQTRGQNCPTHYLNEADVFLLYVMPFRVRMEDAQGVLVSGDVAAQGQEHLVASVWQEARDGRDRIVPHVTATLTSGVRNNAYRCVLPVAPDLQDMLAGIQQLLPAV